MKKDICLTASFSWTTWVCQHRR